jgi:hypothetical protein
VIYDVGNPGSVLGQAQQYVGVKSLNWLMGPQPFSLDNRTIDIYIHYTLFLFITILIYLIQTSSSCYHMTSIHLSMNKTYKMQHSLNI